MGENDENNGRLVKNLMMIVMVAAGSVAAVGTVATTVVGVATLGAWTIRYLRSVGREEEERRRDDAERRRDDGERRRDEVLIKRILEEMRREERK